MSRAGKINELVKGRMKTGHPSITVTITSKGKEFYKLIYVGHSSWLNLSHYAKILETRLFSRGAKILANHPRFIARNTIVSYRALTTIIFRH